MKHSACDNNLRNSCYTCFFDKRQCTPSAFYYSKCAPHLNSCGRQLLVKLNLTWISCSLRLRFLKPARKRVSTISHQIGLYFVIVKYMNWRCDNVSLFPQKSQWRYPEIFFFRRRYPAPPHLAVDIG